MTHGFFFLHSQQKISSHFKPIKISALNIFNFLNSQIVYIRTSSCSYQPFFISPKIIFLGIVLQCFSFPKRETSLIAPTIILLLSFPTSLEWFLALEKFSKNNLFALNVSKIMPCTKDIFLLNYFLMNVIQLKSLKW